MHLLARAKYIIDQAVKLAMVFILVIKLAEGTCDGAPAIVRPSIVDLERSGWHAPEMAAAGLALTEARLVIG